MNEAIEAPAGQEPAEKPRKLTRRQQRFADEYLTGVSGAEAQRRIGRKGTAQEQADAAYRMLKLPQVKAYIEERRKNLSEATGVRAEQIVRELSLIGFGSLKDLFHEDGRLKQMQEITADQAAMLASVEVEKLYSDALGTVTKIRAWNKKEALELAAKILGFLREKVDIDLNAPPPIINIMPYDDADESERAARAAVSRHTPPA